MYWANFPSRSARARKVAPPPDFRLSDYRIEATVKPDLSLDAVTRVKVTPAVGWRAGGVVRSAPTAMTVSRATVDGRPAEVLQREAARVDLMRGGNAFFLVVAARAPAGRAHLRIRDPSFRQDHPGCGRPRVLRRRARQLVSHPTGCSGPITTCFSACRPIWTW